MTKKFEFYWQINVPEPLLNGAVFDRWTEEKDNTDSELNCTFKVDEYGFFIYWKSEGRVSLFTFNFRSISNVNIFFMYFVYTFDVDYCRFLSFSSRFIIQISILMFIFPPLFLFYFLY